jgi:transposase
MQTMYYIGLDGHKRTISYCVKDGGGTIHAEGTILATRFELDRWMTTLPEARSGPMEATVFTGWILPPKQRNTLQARFARDWGSRRG